MFNNNKINIFFKTHFFFWIQIIKSFINIFKTFIINFKKKNTGIKKFNKYWFFNSIFFNSDIKNSSLDHNFYIHFTNFFYLLSITFAATCFVIFFIKTYYKHIFNSYFFYFITNNIIFIYVFICFFFSVLQLNNFIKKGFSIFFFDFNESYDSIFSINYFKVLGIFFLYFFFIFTTITCFFYNNKSKNFFFYKKELFFYFSFTFVIIVFSFMVISINLISIYIGIEVFSIIMYIAIGIHNDENKVSSLRKAELSIKYMLASFVGSITFLIGVSFSFLYFGDFVFTNYFYIYPSFDELNFFGNSKKISIGFIVIGLCIKIGIAPYHSWISNVYDSFSNKLFYFSMVYPKYVFFFILYNIFINFPSISFFSVEFENFFFAFGAINIILGTISATYQTNIKRFIMYSSIANSGYIFMSFSSDTIFGYSSINYLFIYFFSINFFFIVFYNLFDKQEYIKHKTWNISNFSKIKNFFDKFVLTISLLNFSGTPPFIMFFAKLPIISNFIINEKIFSTLFVTFFSIVSAYYSIKPIIHIWFYNQNKVRSAQKKNYNNTYYCNFYDSTKYKMLFNSYKNTFNKKTNDSFFSNITNITYFKLMDKSIFQTSNKFSNRSVYFSFINIIYNTNYFIIKIFTIISIMGFFISNLIFIMYSSAWEFEVPYAAFMDSNHTFFISEISDAIFLINFFFTDIIYERIINKFWDFITSCIFGNKKYRANSDFFNYEKVILRTGNAKFYYTKDFTKGIDYAILDKIIYIDKINSVLFTFMIYSIILYFIDLFKVFSTNKKSCTIFYFIINICIDIISNFFKNINPFDSLVFLFDEILNY